MVLFVGNSTNVIICECFQVNTAGFTAYTILPFLACSLASFIILAIQFCSEEYILRKFYVRGNLDVRVVLLDPVGACVGSTMLGLGLVAIIVLSQNFQVEVWVISLSFAFAQFLWDLGWDTYRYAIGRLVVSEGENKKYDTDEEDYHIMLRQLNTNATINKDELGLRTKPENAVSNGVATTSAVPNTVPFHQPIQGITTVTFDERTNSIEPIDMPNRGIPTVTFDETHPSSPAPHPIKTLGKIGFYFLVHICLKPFSNYLHRPTTSPFRLSCNTSGTNIGATILLTKIVRAAALSYVPPSSGQGPVNTDAFLRSAAIALAVASNIGAVSFTFSASLAGLLWRQILTQKEIIVAQKTFARWNLFPVTVMTIAGLAVVSAEMAVLYHGKRIP